MSKRLDQKFYFPIPYSFVLHDPDYGGLSPTAQAAFVRVLAYMASLYPDATNGQTVINASTMKFITGRPRVDTAELLLREIEDAGLLHLHLQGDARGGSKCATDAQKSTERRLRGVPKWYLEVKNINKIKGEKSKTGPSYSEHLTQEEGSKRTPDEEAGEEARRANGPAPDRNPETCDRDHDTEAERRSKARSRSKGNGGWENVRSIAKAVR